MRGMLSGVVAGLLALVFARIFGEPAVGNAISFESALDAAKGDAPEPELVSRAIQSSFGLATGVLVYAIAFGGLFALAFAFAYGRVGRLTPRATAAVVALGGFLVAFVVPFLKYPANPPSIGNPDTIGERTATYFVMVVLSIAIAVGATYLGRRLLPRLGGWNATLVAIAAFIAVAAIAAFLLPAINEVPTGFPAAVLWNFRVASLGTQLVMWTTIGLLFGALVHRPLTQRAALLAATAH
ncbi:CbtA family protein [Fodinicola feengrottensis]|uniref:CbtA family protein n=1 Tax=Fodinicola feengrottensis TaxID=435914 RepID=A0ABP4V8U9_9ACTN